MAKKKHQTPEPAPAPEVVAAPAVPEPVVVTVADVGPPTPVVEPMPEPPVPASVPSVAFDLLVSLPGPDGSLIVGYLDSAEGRMGTFQPLATFTRGRFERIGGIAPLVTRPLADFAYFG